MIYKDMISSLVVIVVGVLPAILAAPVSQTKGSLTSQIKDQEQALETLAAKSQKGVLPQNLQLTRTFSYSNVNGAENQQNSFEEKVFDPEKGIVTSDLKEKLSEAKNSAESPIEESYKGSLDVPALGIHKEVTNRGTESESYEQNEDGSELKDTVEFTPKAVAEYLARTGEMDEFKELLNELVEASEITSEDAENYERSVMDEYYKLMQNADFIKANEEETPSRIPVNKQPLYPSYNDVEQSDVFPLYGYSPDSMKAAEEAKMDMYINYLMNRPVTLDEMISSLMDEWLTRAIVSGDPEAEQILSNIVDYVTRDDNPNDEEQVREILGDIFAEALLEDLTPRIQPQSLPDVPAVVPQPQFGAVDQDQALLNEPVKEPALPEKKSEEQKVEVPSIDKEKTAEDRPKN